MSCLFLWPTVVRDATVLQRIVEKEVAMHHHPGLADRPVYLDHNATTPVDPRVVEGMHAALTTEFGNPSSTHAYAEGPRRLLAHARGQVAGLLGAHPGEIVFTASGTEADALAVRGAVLARAVSMFGRPHVVTQVTEHPAVLSACAHLRRWHDVDVTYVDVDRHGRVDPRDIRAAMTPSTVLVTVMHANNETGTIQPIADIAEVTRSRGVLLHTDAAQSAGKVALDVDDLRVDLLTVVGHKMYAPKGVAALYVRDGVALEPLVGGGGQERGLRAGTENVALAVALGAAAEVAEQVLAAGEDARLTALRDQLHAELDGRLRGRVHLHGHPTRRLPNTLNVRVDGLTGPELLAAAPDVAASTGAACHSGDHRPSGGLLALGLTRSQAAGAVRLSLGRWTTPEVVTRASSALGQAATGGGIGRPSPRPGDDVREAQPNREPVFSVA
jgi:cysteine desulfurase